MSGTAYLGTCSWNYDSWVGLVYSHPCRTAAEYLREYAGKYRSAEIDSWFYKIPSEAEVREYGAAVDEGFRFICKAPQDLTLVLTRGKVPSRNPSFLSPELFGSFYDRIAPLGDRIGAIVLEFEYLNRQKMGGVGEFLDRLGAFVRAIPRGMPIAIEPRNGGYLGRDYFSFLKDLGLIHVFSEKQYMPPIASVYDEFRDYLVDATILRLLGGDRKVIEAKAGERWDRIVDEKLERTEIARMVRNLMIQGKTVYIDVNNHYEGSAPLTIEGIRGMLEEREAQ
jgi:uncharacterized protein YecE (DUF72 family)